MKKPRLFVVTGFIAGQSASDLEQARESAVKYYDEITHNGEIAVYNEQLQTVNHEMRLNTKQQFNQMGVNELNITQLMLSPDFQMELGEGQLIELSQAFMRYLRITLGKAVNYHFVLHHETSVTHAHICVWGEAISRDELFHAKAFIQRKAELMLLNNLLSERALEKRAA